MDSDASISTVTVLGGWPLMRSGFLLRTFCSPRQAAGLWSAGEMGVVGVGVGVGRATAPGRPGLGAATKQRPSGTVRPAPEALL
jgi:hypothetical protein